MKTQLRWIGMWMILVATVCAEPGGHPPVTRQEAALLTRVSELSETDPAAALALLKEALEDGRASAALDYTAANLLLADEQWDAAAKAYRIALGKWPAFVEARAGLARAQALLGRWTDAVETLHDVARQPDAPESVLLLYGHALLHADRWISAESIFRRAALESGDSRDALYGLAQSFMAQQRLAEAAAVMRELVQVEPMETRYWTLWADALLARDEREEAGIVLETARRIGATNARMLALQGELFLNAGRMQAAVAVFDQAIAKDEMSDAMRLRLAEGLLFANELDRAGDLLNAVQEDEKPTRYYRVRARWAELSDQPEAARAAYAAWIDVEPVNPRALLAMGDWWFRDGALDDAALWYERAVQATPRHAEALQRLAQVAVERRDYETAVTHLEHALVLEGDPSVERALQQVRRLVELSNH